MNQEKLLKLLYQQGCLEVQEQFYEQPKSWGAVLEQVLISIQPRQITASQASEKALR